MKKMKTALCTCAESPCPEPEPALCVLLQMRLFVSYAYDDMIG